MKKPRKKTQIYESNSILHKCSLFKNKYSQIITKFLPKKEIHANGGHTHIGLNFRKMKHSGRLIINIEEKGKSYFLLNGTESYYKKLRLAFVDI